MIENLKEITEGIASFVVRLATEIELLFILLSLIFAIDAFLYAFKKQSLLTFDWSLGQGVNIGAVLLFLALFSLTMTFVSPLLLWGLGLLRFPVMLITSWRNRVLAIARALVGLSVLLWRFTDTTFIRVLKIVASTFAILFMLFIEPDEDKDEKDPVRLGFVRISKLRNLALLNKDSFLLDWLTRQEKADDFEARHKAKMARLAVSVVLLGLVNYYVGRATHATLSWKFAEIANEPVQWLTLIFCIFLGLGIRAALFQSPYKGWIYYPPLAEQERDERNKDRTFATRTPAIRNSTITNQSFGLYQSSRF